MNTTTRNRIISGIVAVILGIGGLLFIPINTFHVSKTGSNSNNGSFALPYETIQFCLDKVQAGEECLVHEGNYNESLTLKTTGTVDKNIYLTASGIVTVNSGSQRTLCTSGTTRYYTIDGKQKDGIKFISTFVDASHPSKDATLNFANCGNFWGTGFQGEVGLDGFTLKNCYVEGGVYFYGSDNLIENCTFNGKKRHNTAITMAYEPSENIIVRNNECHDYLGRCVWVLQLTDNIEITDNHFHHVKEAVDCDGAGYAVHSCNIRRNHIHNVTGENILMENAFVSVIEYNDIHDSANCVGTISYNKDNSPDPFKSSEDYKPQTMNTVIRFNVCYNISETGVRAAAVTGNFIENNTFYNIQGRAISFEPYSGIGSPNWTVKNNIIASAATDIFFMLNPPVSWNNNWYADSVIVVDLLTSRQTYEQWQASGKDRDSKRGDPMFVNPSAGDFRVQNPLVCGYGAIPCGATVSTTTPIATDSPIPPTGTPTFTRTPTSTVEISQTVSIVPSTLTRTQTPTATNTPSFTPSRTSTPTRTITPTRIASETPSTPQSICMKVTRISGVNIRPSASLFNASFGTYFINAVIQVEAILNKIEIINGSSFSQTWARVRYDHFFAIKINSTVYAKIVSCP